jgi:hypothetical protein
MTSWSSSYYFGYHPSNLVFLYDLDGTALQSKVPYQRDMPQTLYTGTLVTEFNSDYVTILQQLYSVQQDGATRCRDGNNDEGAKYVPDITTTWR